MASSDCFTVLYRWRLHDGQEQSFVDAWSRLTKLLKSQREALGSRLHRGSDGIWYAYAQWPTAQARELAFAAGSVDPQASASMRSAIAEALPEVILEVVEDHLVGGPSSAR
jgi:hypothetical protein